MSSMQTMVMQAWDTTVGGIVFHFIIQFYDHYIILLATKPSDSTSPFTQEWIEKTTAIENLVTSLQELLT